MTFEEYCKSNSDDLFKQISQYIPNREPFEHYKMVSDYTNRRGKYMRPNLLLLWAELFGVNKEKSSLPACAIQIAEDWLLMHDDWEDANELRRGKPTAHVLYGDVFAVNAGDSSHMVMWKIVHDAANRLNDKEAAERFFEKFYDIMLVTTEGQYYDFKLTQNKDITSFSLEDYWQSIHAKAAYYSVYGPMQLGAILAGQSEETVGKIKEYGLSIGRAFQIKDDILDCVSCEETLGKTIGNDILEGTKTAILWHFVNNSNPGDLEIVKEIYRKDRKEKTKEDVQKVVELFKKTKSIEFAEDLVDKLYKEAIAAFEKNTASLPDSESKETAKDAIEKIAKRKR